MITIPPGLRVLAATRPVDFRKGPHGLAALASQVLGEDPFSGTVLVFRSKRAERIKLLVWDGSGLVLVWRQLPQGGFHWPPVMDGVMRLSVIEFAALFDGLDWWRVQAPRRISTPTAAAWKQGVTHAAPTLSETDAAALRALVLAMQAERDLDVAERLQAAHDACRARRASAASAAQAAPPASRVEVGAPARGPTAAWPGGHRGGDRAARDRGRA